MVEGIHFDLSKTSWKDLGWKSLAVNLSDIAAMGCIPKLSTVSLGLQPSTPVEGITQLYEGMLEICEKLKIPSTRVANIENKLLFN